MVQRRTVVNRNIKYVSISVHPDFYNKLENIRNKMLSKGKRVGQVEITRELSQNLNVNIPMLGGLKRDKVKRQKR